VRKLPEGGGHVRVKRDSSALSGFRVCDRPRADCFVPGINEPAPQPGPVSGRALATAQQVLRLVARRMLWSRRQLSENGAHLDYGLDACSRT